MFGTRDGEGGLSARVSALNLRRIERERVPDLAPPPAAPPPHHEDWPEDEAPVDFRPGPRSARRGTPHAVVIGSGFGGLAAAVRLGARGYRVSVLEQLDQPGGRARVHRIDGFVFDAGPTVITAPHLFEELWALCGRRLADDVTLCEKSPLMFTLSTNIARWRPMFSSARLAAA